jgi:hypothetical protein
VHGPVLSSYVLSGVGESWVNLTGLAFNEPAWVNCTATPLDPQAQGFPEGVLPAVHATSSASSSSTQAVLVTGLHGGVTYSLACEAGDVLNNTASYSLGRAQTLDATAPSVALRRLFVGPSALDLVLQLDEPGNVT